MDRFELLLWCRKKCNDDKLEDVGDFSLVLNEVERFFRNTGIQSESIGGVLSQSFSAETQKELNTLLSPYRKARFL